MTPQQKKAYELVERFWVYAAANQNGSWKNAIQCAIICVEDILKADPPPLTVNEWNEVLNELKSRL